jgi:hypothetical protein
MLAVLAEHGMEPRALPGGRVWRVAVGIRAA